MNSLRRRRTILLGCTFVVCTAILILIQQNRSGSHVQREAVRETETHVAKAQAPADSPSTTPETGQTIPDPAAGGAAPGVVSFDRTKLPDFFASAPIREERWRKVGDGSQWRHERLVQVNGAPDTIRVTEVWSSNAAGEASDLLWHQAAIADQVIVQFSPELQSSEVAALVEAGHLRVRRMLHAPGLAVVATDGISLDGPETAIARLVASGDVVKYAQLDVVMRAFALIPNDSRFSEQWALNAAAGATDFGLRATEGWSIRTDASNVIVAIIDSGMRMTHADLAENLWTNSHENPGNGHDDDGNGYVDDVHGINAITGSGSPVDDEGHGTAVAGVIGARGNNGVGIAGVAWRVQLMPLKFLNSEGVGSLSNEIECIDYAIANGAKIINASYGAEYEPGQTNQSEADAIARARAAGVLFVAAAGNEIRDIDRLPVYPASHRLDNVVSVASHASNGVRSYFSNWGSVCIALSAPGEGIVTLGNSSDAATTTASGTSLAAPHVAGVLALMRAQYPNDASTSLVDRLLASVDLLPYGFSNTNYSLLGYVRAAGWLRLDRALGQTSAPVHFPHITEPLESFEFGTGDALSLSVEAEGDAPLTYEWRRGWTTLPGNTSQLSFSNLTAFDAGEYGVRVINSAGYTAALTRLTQIQTSTGFNPHLDAPTLEFQTASSSWSADNDAHVGATSIRLFTKVSTNSPGFRVALPDSGTLTFYMRAGLIGNEGQFDVRTRVRDIAHYTAGTNGQWQPIEVHVAPGDAYVSFTLRKLGFDQTTEHRVWLDGFVWRADKPEILRQPQSASAGKGGSARFTVSARGARPLGYQWRRNAVDIVGATSSTLDLTSLTPASAGDYTVVVSNTSGSVVSSVAKLSVLDAPEPVRFTNFPALQQYLAVGSSSSLDVQVSGTGPITFSWFKDGTLLPTTGPSLALTGVSSADSGKYEVRATNSIWQTALVFQISVTAYIPQNGGVTSLGGYPTEIEVMEGAPLNISIPMVGGTNLRWTQNGFTISGATGPNYSVAAATANDAGNYQLFATSSFASFSLRPIAVRVMRPSPDAAAAVGLSAGWLTSADAPWGAQSAISFSAPSAMRSGAPGRNRESRLALPVAGPQTVTGRVRTSSESGADVLEVLLDGVRVRQFSGETDWQDVSVRVPSGSHRVDWVYRKDDEGDVGADAAWLDDVRLIPSPPALLSAHEIWLPLDLTADVSLTLDETQSVVATNLPPGLAYSAATGHITGTPTVEGDVTTALRLTGPGGVTDDSIVFHVIRDRLTFDEFDYRLTDRPIDLVRKVVFGDGRWVAVGPKRLLAYSDNGYDWRGVVSPNPDSDMVDIAYNAGRFVAVGIQSVVQTSLNRGRWQQIILAGFELHGVAFANGWFVIAGGGAGGAVFRSQDGISWQVVPVSGASKLLAIRWLGDRFRTVSDSGKWYESSDGVSWTQKGSFNTQALTLVDGELGDDGGIVTSNQGSVTTPQYYYSRWRTDGTFVSTLFAPSRPTIGSATTHPVFVGGKWWQSRGSLFYSDDGVATQTALGLTGSSAVQFVGTNGTSLYGWGDRFRRSADGGSTWQAVAGAPTYPIVSSLVNNAERVRAIATTLTGQRIALDSFDGITWLDGGAATEEDMTVFEANGRHFKTLTGKIMVSDDLISWATFNLPNVSYPVRSVFYGAGWYLVSIGPNFVGAFPPTVFRTKDFTNWEQLNASVPVYGGITPLGFVRNHFVGTAGSGSIVSSEDAGVTWRLLAPSPAGVIGPRTMLPIVEGGGILVAVGNNGLVVRSEDGEHWQAGYPGTSESFLGVVHDGRMFIAYGGDHVFTSFDGVQWKAQMITTFANAKVIFKGNAIFAAKNGGIAQFGSLPSYDAPRYSALPTHRAAAIGELVVLRANVGGADPLRLQWYRDGVAVAGATGAELSFVAGPDTIGHYQLEIANARASVRTTEILVGLDQPIAPGLYAGEFQRSDGAGETGTFALLVRSNGSASLMGSLGSGPAVVQMSLQVDATGKIRPPITASGFFASASQNSVSATGVGTGVVGQVGNLVFAGEPIGSGDVAFYDSVLPYSSDSHVRVFVPTSGQAFVFANDGEWAVSSVVTPAVGGAISGSSGTANFFLNVSSGRLTGVFNETGGNPKSVLAVLDDAPGQVRLANISTRGQVLTGDSALIAGFVVTGPGTKSILLRAAGPALAGFGVSGTLAQPSIILRDFAGNILGQNTGWAGDANIAAKASQLLAFPFDPASADSAILANVPAGLYTAQISGVGSTTGVALVEVYDGGTGATNEPRLVNISTRGVVGQGSGILIAGFVITGQQPRHVLVRGIGPALTQFGLSGALANPRLDIFDSNRALVLANDDWSSGTNADAIVAASAQVQAFALSSGSKDASILMWLAPGIYTAQVTSADGQPGIALAEIYEVP